jgi:organic radical activating enzyme
VQGEGMNAGRPAVFVRFAGCNLWTGLPEHRTTSKGACAQWCDTDFASSQRYTMQQLVEAVDAAGEDDDPDTRLVVLTGGEPMLQVSRELVYALAAGMNGDRWQVAIETNGTIEIDFPIHWITCSPKLGEMDVKLSHCNELKVVLPGTADGSNGWTVEQLIALQDQLSPDVAWVMPQDRIDPTRVEESLLRKRSNFRRERTEFNQSVRQCIAMARALGWRVGAQTHKVLDIP